jgi:hypothetical protein
MTGPENFEQGAATPQEALDSLDLGAISEGMVESGQTSGKTAEQIRAEGDAIQSITDSIVEKINARGG